MKGLPPERTQRHSALPVIRFREDTYPPGPTAQAAWHGPVCLTIQQQHVALCLGPHGPSVHLSPSQYFTKRTEEYQTAPPENKGESRTLAGKHLLRFSDHSVKAICRHKHSESFCPSANWRATTPAITRQAQLVHKAASVLQSPVRMDSLRCSCRNWAGPRISERFSTLLLLVNLTLAAIHQNESGLFSSGTARLSAENGSGLKERGSQGGKGGGQLTVNRQAILEVPPRLILGADVTAQSNSCYSSQVLLGRGVGQAAAGDDEHAWSHWHLRDGAAQGAAATKGGMGKLESSCASKGTSLCTAAHVDTTR